jgi:hypothetical protein
MQKSALEIGRERFSDFWIVGGFLGIGFLKGMGNGEEEGNRGDGGGEYCFWKDIRRKEKERMNSDRIR